LTNISHCDIFGQEILASLIVFKEKDMTQPSAEIWRQEPGKREPRSRFADRELNLKGKICPYTFIESMLALEEMETNQILRVIVDYPPAVCDVPRSLKNEGYEILEVASLNETDWEILIRNKEGEDT
jgi:tRNA 2-thiouridine synthesizing protein A